MKTITWAMKIKPHSSSSENSFHSLKPLNLTLSRSSNADLDKRWYSPQSDLPRILYRSITARWRWIRDLKRYAAWFVANELFNFIDIFIALKPIGYFSLLTKKWEMRFRALKLSAFVSIALNWFSNWCSLAPLVTGVATIRLFISSESENEHQYEN